MPTKETRLYTLAVFNAEREVIACIPNLELAQAYKKADQLRPRLGSSYVTLDGTPLQFKPCRHLYPLNPRYPSTRRSTPRAIETKALQFQREGDHANAAALLDLLTPTNEATK